MGRPTEPLISRDSTLQAALDIIDDDGLEALSMRRLGTALGVSGASLYHHFENKDAIITAVAVMALQTRGDGAMVDPNQHWKEWLPPQARKLRDTMVEHPALIPVFVNQQDIGVGGRVLEIWIARMLQAETPIDVVMPILDALRYWAIASALHETQGEGNSDPEFQASFPLLTMVRGKRGALSDDIFESICHSIIDAIESHSGKLEAARAVRPRTQRARKVGSRSVAASNRNATADGNGGKVRATRAR